MPNHPWRILAKELYKHKDVEHVTAKITSTPLQIQINCPDEKSYRLVQQFLTINNSIVNFHSFPLPSEKSLKVIIRGLPLDISDDELMDELKSLDFEPNFVRPFYMNGKRIPIHMVSLKQTESAKDIYTIPNLLYVKVKIEAYKQTGPAQCFTCQQFGHSSFIHPDA